MKSWIEFFRFSSPAVRALTAATVLAIVVIPLWSINVPPLLDYHNHLARQYILASLPDSPQLQTFYAANWKATPYLAIDAIVQGLAVFLPVDVAGKLFLTLMLLFLALAPLALNWAVFGRVTPIALLGLLFVHNTTVTLGFVSYVFGIGFALCLLALWIRLRETAASVRIAVFAILAALLFFSHLLGFIIYGLSAAAYELGRHVALVSRRRFSAPFRINADQAINLFSLTCQLLLPLSIFLLFGPSTESVSSNTYGGVLRKVELLAGIFSYLMPPYAWRWDTGLALLIPAGLLALLVTRKLEVSRPMLWPLGAVMAFFFAMPVELFGGWGADHRILPVIGLMFVGSLRLRAEERGVALFFSSAIIAVVAIRVATVTVEWRKADVEYGEYLRAFEAVADGSRMFFAFGEAEDKQIGRRPYRHMPTLVLMKKDVFVPYLFAGNSGVGPLQYKPAFDPLREIARGKISQNGRSPRWSDVIASFDYVMLVDERLFSEPLLRQLVPVFKGDRVTVYRTRGR